MEYTFADELEVDDWVSSVWTGATSPTLAHSSAEEALVITPVWGDTTDEFVVYAEDTEQDYDLTGGAIFMDVYVPAAYVDDGNAVVQVYLNDIADVYGSIYYSSVGSLTGDTYNTLAFVNINGDGGSSISGGSFDATQVNLLGLQLKANGKAAAVEGDLMIDNVMVIPASEQPADVDFPLDSGWRVNPGALTMNATADSVSYNPTAGSDQLVYDTTEPNNMSYALLTLEYSVDQTFKDSGAVLQPFVQIKSGSWTGKWCWINNADLAITPTTTYCVINVADYVDGTGDGFQVGVQTNSSSALTGTVTIHSASISPVFE